MEIIKNDIKNLEYIFNLDNLKIPYYQRPYVWSEKSITILFNDTYNAYKSSQEEYRLGTIILHYDKKENELNIVDGQQRLISLALLIHNLVKANSLIDEKINKIPLLNEKVNNISKKYIKTNHDKLKELTRSFNSEEKRKYLEYIKTNCTFAVIITNDIAEAFQFFDSQNSRGKSLAPHDLLKAYHLREMNNLSEHEKEDIINKWESIDDKKLKTLFADYLYPVIQWYKGKNGINYNSKKIDVFKGIKENYEYNYSKYHIFSNKFIEKYKDELLSIGYDLNINQFQLTQPLIAGKRFFKYVLHYNNLLDEIINKVKNEDLPDKRTGDKYIKQLYLCVLLFFADRFNTASLDENYMHIMFKWSYALRLVMSSVYRETVNKYACSKHDRLNKHNSIFKDIYNMMKPDEIINVKLMNLNEIVIKYKKDDIISKYNKGIEAYNE